MTAHFYYTNYGMGALQEFHNATMFYNTGKLLTLTTFFEFITQPP